MTDFLLAPWQWPQSVSSVLVAGQTLEPLLTLEQAKLRAGLDWPPGDPRDDLMTGFIQAARQKVELDTGLALPKQTRLITFDAPAGTVLPMPMQSLPLISIVEEPETPIAAAVLWPRGYPLPLVQTTTDPPRFVFNVSAGALSLPYGAWGTYRIESGWPDAAALANDAPLLYQAVGLLTAHYATLGRDLAGPDQTYAVPMGYEDAISPYRLMWVT